MNEDFLTKGNEGNDNEKFNKLILQRLAFEAIDNGDTEWLRKDFPDLPESGLRVLEQTLIAVYAYYSSNTELIKKKAMQLLDIQHKTTIINYLEFALGKGLITVQKSISDARADEIRPTPELLRKIEVELSRRAYSYRTTVAWMEALDKKS